MKIKILTTIYLFALWMPFSAGASDTIELAGKIAQLVNDKDTYSPKKLSNAKELKARLRQGQCPGFRYRQYRVDNTIYVLGARRGKMVIGRNAKYLVDGQVAGMDSIEFSTRGCIALDTGSGMAFVTHLGDSPTAFHAIAAAIHSEELFVSTKGRLWKVTPDAVSEVER